MGSASEINTTKMSLLVDYLAMQIYRNDHNSFCNLCFSLARCIDYAIANNNVPNKALDLPSLLKQICQKNSSHHVKAAIMVLMISIKNACKIGWFSGKETAELNSLANEIGSDFFGGGDTNVGQSSSLTTITSVMERFYPRLKTGQIVASFEVKPGYGTFAIDFHFSKTMQYSPHEKIRLFVAQKDNIETSTCLISPPQVNFLINGRGVNGRTNVYMDTGPQLPTNITQMIKLGPNLLQAVGNFNGHYVIAIAFMSTALSPDSSVLQNYVQPAVVNVDSDSDIIEGPSRISLNCPISYTRIKVPVKGRSCKHLQCFDFYNFVDINSRRPSWRCPHCNQYICYLDIRVDQDMLKVLREVAENVTEVIISADGSWKAILENDHGDGQQLEDSHNHQNERAQQESTAPPDVLDLTEVDDMDTICTFETEDRKPFSSDLRNLSLPTLDVSSGTNTSGMNQNFAAVLDDDFWSGIVSDGILTSSSISDSPVGNGTPATGFTDHMQSAIVTDAVTSALNPRMGVHGHVALSTSALLDQNNLLMQVMNSTENNQYGRVTLTQRHVTRTPVAVQALPAQSAASMQQHGPRTSTVPSAPQVGQGSTTNGDGLNTASPSDSERRQQFSRHCVNPLQATNLSAPFQRPSTAQNRDLQDRSFAPGQSVQAPTIRSFAEFQNPHLQQVLNLRVPHVRNQNPRAVRPLPLIFPRTMSQVGRAHSGAAYAAQRARMMAASERAEMPRQPTAVPLQNQASRPPHSYQTTTDVLRTSAGLMRNVGGMAQSVPMADALADSSSEQNWQPTGRMRGSLAGRAYSAALSQLIIQPTQPVPPARPLSYMTPTSSSVPSIQVQSSINREAHVPQTK